ncbi:MAG: serine hydrolase [Bacteroidia bacterium]|nr:class A beta-lactamase-related serine hydrolase [Bacteroidia bacterium]MDW8014820.1 serine hydrolase [Bacteroidia bacterium]
MNAQRFAWLGFIFSTTALLPPQPYRPQVNSLSAPDTLWLNSFLSEKAPHLQSYIQKAQFYRIQILYTQINRDAQNRPILKHYAFRLDTTEYFYPASLVKLPLAALALERIEHLKAHGITPRTPFSLIPGQTGCLKAAPTKPYSVADCIRRQMVFSDNSAFDYLYALVGPHYATQVLQQRGYTSAYFGHRLGRSCTIQENRCMEGVSFFRERSSPYLLPATCAEGLPPHPYEKHPYLLMPYANSLSLKDAHGILISLIFPQTVRPHHRFWLSSDSYHLLRRYLSMYPSEAKDPDYNLKEYHDGIRKYFLQGGSDSITLPSRIRIFNKVGMAYGYLSDVAYIVDFDLGVEFFLSAVIYVGERQLGSPSAAGYPWRHGLYFLRELGWVIYRYETARRRPYFPKLKNFEYDYRRP